MGSSLGLLGFSLAFSWWIMMLGIFNVPVGHSYIFFVEISFKVLGLLSLHYGIA